MSDPADRPLPDETETLEALAEAATTLHGDLRPAPGGWRLRLPAAAALAVCFTGAAAFPLALATPDRHTALPACADVAEMLEALRAAILHQGSGRAVDLAAHKPAGWQLLPAEAGRIRLARTDPAARGWPAAAEVVVESDAAVVETRQTLATGDHLALAAVDHLLACSSRGLVHLSRKPCPDGAADPPTVLDQSVCYRLATPAATLTARRLADALALVGAVYHDLAPALNALAEHPALAEAYVHLHRRSK